MHPQLTVDQLAARLAEVGAPALTLLDVREPWEVAMAAIQSPSAQTLRIPMGQLTGRMDELDPSQPIVCYCHHGVRSLQVVAFLQRQGFNSVYNLAGGIEAWSTQVDPAVPRY